MKGPTVFAPRAMGPITLRAKSVAVLTAGAPADIATIVIPAGITRWAIFGDGANDALPGTFIVTETAAGSLSAAGIGIYDAAGGGGNPLSIAGTGLLGTAGTVVTPSPGSTVLSSTSNVIVIRQTVASLNAGTASFYITIVPLP